MTTGDESGLGACNRGGEPAFRRREFLGVSIGAALAWALTRPAAADDVSRPKVNNRSAILIWLQGGASHIDSFDPKEIFVEAGPYDRIQTRVPGLVFTDRLPKLAEIADKLSVVRSLVGPESEHNRARYYASSSFRPLSTLDSPGVAAVISHELAGVAMTRAERAGLPAYFSFGEPWAGPGYLGIEHAPFLLHDPERQPNNLSGPNAGDWRFRRRLELLARFEADNPRTAQSPLSQDRQIARAQALAMMASTQRPAFNLAEEPESLRNAYGRGRFGQSCLLARRLVEVGVRVVEIHFDGWDSHVDNFPIHDARLAELDAGLSSLLEDLERRGLAAHTTVLCTGEFGRTPKINSNQGRDHHAACWSGVLAGAGIRRAVVHGKTSPKGAYVTKDEVRIPDLLATLCAAVGVDSGKEFKAAKEKPVSLVDGGFPVEALLDGSPVS